MREERKLMTKKVWKTPKLKELDVKFTKNDEDADFNALCVDSSRNSMGSPGKAISKRPSPGGGSVKWLHKK